MTQDEIIEMAKKVGYTGFRSYTVYQQQMLTDFAKLIAAKEREACEKTCQEERNDPDDQFKSYEDTHHDGWIDGCNSCISAIRARGEA